MPLILLLAMAYGICQMVVHLPFRWIAFAWLLYLVRFSVDNAIRSFSSCQRCTTFAIRLHWTLFVHPEALRCSCWLCGVRNVVLFRFGNLTCQCSCPSCSIGKLLTGTFAGAWGYALKEIVKHQDMPYWSQHAARWLGYVLMVQASARMLMVIHARTAEFLRWWAHKAGRSSRASAIVARLQVQQKSVSDSSHVCPICLAALGDQAVSRLPCGHLVHSDCLLKWLEEGTSPTCPECRHDVSHAADDMV